MALLNTFELEIAAGANQLHADMRTHRATVEAKTANAAVVRIGNAGTQLFELSPGESVEIYPYNLNEIYVAGTVGDKVAVLAWQ